jgi:hypothetical protein
MHVPLNIFSVLTIISLQSVYDSETARKDPSELKVDILEVCVKMFGKAIDELKREILVFMHKNRHAGVVVTDSEDDDKTDSKENDVDRVDYSNSCTG